jgi:hypothetical protein
MCAGKFQIEEWPHRKIQRDVLHRICYYEGQVQNTKHIYSLQIKPLTRQGNEDKIRYFYRKGGTTCNCGIN